MYLKTYTTGLIFVLLCHERCSIVKSGICKDLSKMKSVMYSPFTDLRVQATGRRCVSGRPSQDFSRPDST